MLKNRQLAIDRIPARLIRPVEMRAFDMSAEETVEPHAHEWGQFTYSAEGVLTVLTDDGHFTAPPDMAVWLPPGVIHDIQPVGPAKFRSLYIGTALLKGLPNMCAVLAVDALLRNLILEAANLPREWDENGADGRLMQVLLDRIKCADPAPFHLPLPSDPRLAGVTRALISNPGDRRTLNQHGKAAGASARTLARLFVRETGMTFGKWRRKRILMAALERISEGQTVTAVSMDLGYDSTSAFIAMFHQNLGMTPTQYLASR